MYILCVSDFLDTSVSWRRPYHYAVQVLMEAPREQLRVATIRSNRMLASMRRGQYKYGRFTGSAWSRVLQRGIDSAGNPHKSVDMLFVTKSGVVHGWGVKTSEAIVNVPQPLMVLTGYYALGRERDVGLASFCMKHVRNYSKLKFDVNASGNMCKFLNSCKGTGRAHNCEVFWHGPIPVLWATRPIQVCEELLLRYNM
jgi:hypothetical protein